MGNIPFGPPRRAGLHVLCEKPMALTEKECEDMIKATDNAKVKLMIACRLHFEEANLWGGSKNAS